MSSQQLVMAAPQPPQRTYLRGETETVFVSTEERKRMVRTFDERHGETDEVVSVCACVCVCVRVRERLCVCVRVSE